MPWPSVSLMSLKSSRSMNRAATAVWLRRARTSICSTRSRIEGAVGQAGEGVVRGHEGELLLAAAELLVGALALVLEGLAHPHERHVEAALKHREGALVDGERQPPLLDDLRDRVGGGVAPAQAALGDLVERGGSLRGELPEDVPRLLADVACHLGALAGHPAGDRDRGDRANLDEALFDDLLEHYARFVVAPDDPLDDLLGALVERLTQSAEMTLELHPGGGGDLIYAVRVLIQLNIWNRHGSRCRQPPGLS